MCIKLEKLILTKGIRHFDPTESDKLFILQAHPQFTYVKCNKASQNIS